MILITGNTGYIGAVMTKFFQDRSYKVVGVDCDYYHGCDFFPGMVKPHKQLFKDVDDLVEQDLEGVEAVIHLAALSNDPLGELNPQLTHRTNCLSSVRLAQLAKKVKVPRYLFSSSCSIYGIASGDKAINEQDKVNPLTAYAKAKIDSEVEIGKLADKDFHPVFLRNATAYGLSPRMRLDLVANNLTAWAHLTGKISIMSDGTPWRPIIHIEDISAAFLAVLKAPVEKIHNQAFNVGMDSENYRVKDIAERVKAFVPNSSVEILNTAGSDERSYRVDFSKIKDSVPEFKPCWDLSKGIEQVYAAYKKYNLNKAGFDSSLYFRIRRMQQLIKEGRVDHNIKWRTVNA